MILSSTKGVSPTIPREYHVVFWILYFLFNSVRWGSYFGDYWYSFKSNLLEFPLHILLVYLNIYYLVPRFIIGKRYREYVLYLILALGIHYLAKMGLVHLFFFENVWPEAHGVHSVYGFNHIVAVILGEIYVIGLVSAIKFTIDYVIELNKNHKLLELQSETELNYLKAQIQPHFFFNTLNNLYALTLKRSKKAADVVLKLSAIMEYVIYDANKKKIALQKEINYIQNYIELERIRRGDLVKSQTEIIGEVDNVVVPPFLFLPFVENCFKHGKLDDGRIDIEMKLVRLNGELEFMIKNSFDFSRETKIHGGIGLQNTNRRLELLYGNDFNLNMHETKNQYQVNLKLPLK